MPSGKAQKIRVSLQALGCSARFNQTLEIVEVLIDPMGNGAAEPGGQLQINDQSTISRSGAGQLSRQVDRSFRYWC
jgi:hypothetical protein